MFYYFFLILDYSNDKNNVELNNFKSNFQSINIFHNYFTTHLSKTKLKNQKKLLEIKMNQLKDLIKFQYIIFDCSCWTFVDSVGADALKDVSIKINLNTFLFYLKI